mgnify:CR=1 FL=1
MKALNLVSDVNLDELYEQFCLSSAKINATKVNYTEQETLGISMKWKEIIQKIGKENIPNLYNLICFVLSIPGSNAFILSHESRNWCSIDLIISTNVTDNCKDYLMRVGQNRKLLDASKSNKKYTFKSSIVQVL